MLAPITRQFQDLSSEEYFAFAFHCDHCGKAWHSEKYKFNLRGFEPPIDEKIRTMIWNQQYNEAYERANCEASSIFIRCPMCGCRICDDCFNSSLKDSGSNCEGC